MNALADFHFIRPYWLLLLPVVFFLGWVLRASEDSVRGWRSVIAPELLAALTIGRDSRYRWRGIGLGTAWLIAVIAVAGPTWRPEPSPFADDPVPVMMLLHADDTMGATDMLPTRMERARLKITDFCNGRKGQPLGLIAYAGTPHLVLPPTRDTSVVATMAGEISPEIMPKKGDDLVAAMELAAQTLGSSTGSIVVVTDTVQKTDKQRITRFAEGGSSPIFFLAIARPETPELDSINTAASVLNADVTLMTPGLEDVNSLIRSTARVPVAANVADEGIRWAEAGWWLVPILAGLVLMSFRRETRPTTEK